MTSHVAANALMILLSASLGINIMFWCVVGILRFISERTSRSLLPSDATLTADDVAVVIAAHNEEVALPKCLDALTRILPPAQIYLASDGSRDRTVEIARLAGCNVIDIQPNAGKAKAIDRALREFNLCDRYEAVLIQDADSEIDPDYLLHALPLFNDPRVAVVAGHVLSRWRDQFWPSVDMVYAAYRTRLYRLLQLAFQYGQTWKWTNVTYIAPGFASMYRTSALSRIDITAPGVIIEDFNMTFEVQRKKLGRITYSPKARCSSEDPFKLKDYRKQVLRWYLGFWQTVRRHGIWPSLFWLSLGGLLIELLLIAMFSLCLPLLVLAFFLTGTEAAALSLADLSVRPVSPLYLAMLFLAVDYALTVIVAAIERRPSLLIYGLAFPLIRLLDAVLFLRALAQSFFIQSDGRWVSPERHLALTIANPGDTHVLNGR